MSISQAGLVRAVSLLGVAVALAGTKTLLAQSQTASPTAMVAAPMRFEVASIHPHKTTGDDPSNRRMLPGGRFVATGTSVRTLVRIAFGTDDNWVIGAPGWIGDETFDITATTEGHVDVTRPEQFQQAVLSLLEERFGFKFHREKREAPVYWLELEKPGVPGQGLKPSTADSPLNMSVNSSGTITTMKASKIPMVDVAAALRRQAGRPVEDHTGLKGDFDFQIEWSPEETAESPDPSLFTVLKERLGLKLRPAKGIVEMIVIDQVTRPSEN